MNKISEFELKDGKIGTYATGCLFAIIIMLACRLILGIPWFLGYIFILASRLFLKSEVTPTKLECIFVAIGVLVITYHERNNIPMDGAGYMFVTFGIIALICAHSRALGPISMK